MLSKGDTQKFLLRNEDQATNLKKGLLGRHQKLYLKPEVEVRKASRSRALRLRAANPYAHNIWFRAIGDGLAQALDLRRPCFELKQPLFFLTLSSKAMVRSPRLDQDEEIDIEDCVELYRNAFWGENFNMIGIVEPAMYVYCGAVLGSAPIYHYHLHALCGA